MAKTDPALALLGNVDLFQGLTRKELGEINEQSRQQRFRAGQVMAAQGEKGGRFFLILDGEATVSVSGRPQTRLGPGDYFGEMSLLDGEPRSATVTADRDVVALTITSFNFRPLLREHPAIAEKILLELCHRLRAIEEALTARSRGAPVV